MRRRRRRSEGRRKRERREMGDAEDEHPLGEEGGGGWVGREASVMFVQFGFMVMMRGGQVGLRFGHPTKIQQQTTNQAPASIPYCTLSVKKKNVTIKFIRQYHLRPKI